MKILIIILILIGSIIAILLVAALFVKKDYTIQREIVIDQPKEEVFNYLKLLRNHNHFNKWMMADPNTRKEYRGTDGSTGFVLSWDSDSKNVGKGEQEITAVKEGEQLEYAMRFIKPFSGKAAAQIRTTDLAASQTKVRWTFNSSMKYPMNAMMLFVDIPGMLGRDLDTSLHTLKAVLEKSD